MMVNITHAEVVQAVSEWVKRHHGLNVSGEPTIYVDGHQGHNHGADTVAHVMLHFPEATGDISAGPYRTPSEP